ncbi:oocyte zinc finger protein XlCOF26-like [Pollicipes pollicipes]|uniref:oocyte zinc finger protein XlCOF26-like n=1 Tax=Pollicipes pollicipes TaxID=41117 RepID=UPI00188585A1|nr:oocyte zinc finger protein XlCOF26-like [Pollicipes pollicipes]
MTSRVQRTDSGGVASGSPWRPSIKCDICGRVFTAASTYRNHKAFHRGETACPICNYVFTEKGNLKAHIRRVHGMDVGGVGGWFPGKQCPKCDRRFNAYSSYRNHLPLHRGETTCPICHYVFTEKGNLKAHMRRVHGVDVTAR